MLSKKVVLFVTFSFAAIVVISLIFPCGGAGLGLLSFLFASLNVLMAIIFGFEETRSIENFLIDGRRTFFNWI